MFPLSTVLFPHARAFLHVFEPRYRAMVADCLAGDRRLGVVLIARGSEVGGGDQRVDVGTLASIETAEPAADGRWHLAVEGLACSGPRGGSTTIPTPGLWSRAATSSP